MSSFTPTWYRRAREHVFLYVQWAFFKYGEQVLILNSIQENQCTHNVILRCVREQLLPKKIQQLSQIPSVCVWTTSSSMLCACDILSSDTSWVSPTTFELFQTQDHVLRKKNYWARNDFSNYLKYLSDSLFILRTSDQKCVLAFMWSNCYSCEIWIELEWFMEIIE
jgi:hypothetical protein